jgi:hypothetical protein
MMRYRFSNHTGTNLGLVVAGGPGLVAGQQGPLARRSDLEQSVFTRSEPRLNACSLIAVAIISKDWIAHELSRYRAKEIS